MAFNGSGIFARLYNWVNDANAGIAIKSARMDAEDNGFATGLSNCICKDGQTTITANLPMAGFKHTGVGNATLVNHYAAAGQVQNGAFVNLGTSAGTNTATASATPTLTAYAAGQAFRFIVGVTCTSAVTLNIDGLGAKAVQKLGAALVAGDLTANDAVEVFYDGTQFQLLTPARTPVLASGAFLPSATGTTQNTLASATSTDLGTITTQNVLISGTTTITGFGSSASLASPIYLIEFSGILTLTNNATSLIIPGGANITTAAGDTAIVEYLGSGNWRVRQYNKATGTAVISPTITQPTRQYLKSGSSATYTTPANCKAIVVREVAGGGGGAATATNAGSVGGTTSFNSISVVGGSGGSLLSVPGGGQGGTGGSGSADLRLAGGGGTSGLGGAGGNSVFGGGGASIANGAGIAGAANTGGGGGGGDNGTNFGGSGGGGGEYAEFRITTPSATYTYTVGAGGAGGAAGTNAGGAGGSGLIIVDEYY